MLRVQKFDDEKVEKQVLELMQRTVTPVSIDYVAHHLKIAWATARGLLLNMTIKGKIEAEKTTKSLIFRLSRNEAKLNLELKEDNP